MSHNEERTDWWKEGLYALLTGCLYGGTNTLVGHPFDTVKTKMQAQAEHLTGGGYIESIVRVAKNEGPIGFYRGCVPPFFGSVIFRSLQFSVFESFYTYWEGSRILTKEIPFVFGLQWRVLLAGWVAASSRAFIECPFEYAKVRR